MVHYESARALKIENVEHSIHILGVQAQALVGCFWAFLAMLTVSPIAAPFGALLAALIARFFFYQEQQGRPLTFSRGFLGRIDQVSLLKAAFPSVVGVIVSKGEYCGS